MCKKYFTLFIHSTNSYWAYTICQALLGTQQKQSPCLHGGYIPVGKSDHKILCNTHTHTPVFADGLLEYYERKTGDKNDLNFCLSNYKYEESRFSRLCKQLPNLSMCYANALIIRLSNFAYFLKNHKWPQWSSHREMTTLTTIPKVPKDSLV